MIYPQGALNQFYSIMFSKPEVKGQPPRPRADHAAVLVKARLIIYGGRNDNLYSPFSSNCIQEVSIFNIEQFHWEEVHMFGDLPANRYSFCFANLGQKILIFGGMRINKFCNSEVYSLETEESTVADCVKGWMNLLEKRKEYNRVKSIERLGKEKVKISSYEIRRSALKNIVPDMIEQEWSECNEEDSEDRIRVTANKLNGENWKKEIVNTLVKTKGKYITPARIEDRLPTFDDLDKADEKEDKDERKFKRKHSVVDIHQQEI